MKSRTSFSKLTPFRKDITRFAPIWALYLIGMLLVLFESTNYSEYDWLGREMGEIVKAFGIVNLIYAAVCAVMLFGDLYNTRMCYSLHTMPQRRETWFLSHIGAGVVFSLVPNTVAALFLMTRLEAYWFLALYWLLAVTLQFLFFYGVAAFSAMLTGNRFAMLLVYAGLNFFSMLAYWALDVIYLPQMPGVILDTAPFFRLCPAVDLMDSWEFFQFENVSIPNPNSPYMEEMRNFYQYEGLSDGWGYLAILGVVGLALLGLALLLYRLRHLESAGDFVAFPKLKGAACVIMTVCVACVAAFFGKEMMGNDYMIWLFVGLIVGFFGSLMLLERRVKVFRPKAFLGLGVLAAVLVCGFLLVKFDVFGVVQWTPEADQVKQVTIANYESTNYHYDGYYYGDRICVTLDTHEDIEKIIDAHEDILNRLGKTGSMNNTHRVVFTYKLTDGRTVKRSYMAPANGRNYQIISEYFYTPEQVLGYTDWEKYVSSVEYIGCNGVDISPDCYEMLLEALRSDCEKGYVTTSYSKDSVYYMDIQVYYPEENRSIYREVQVLSGASETLALLKSPEFILGYADWDAFLSNLETLYVVDGWEVPRNEWRSLMEALRRDCEDGNINLEYTGEGEYVVEYSGVSDSGRKFYRFLEITKYAENFMAWVEEYYKK